MLFWCRLTATEWLTGTLLGSVAISLCVMAVGFVGLTMMTGRIALRDGIRVALGCFILLGAPRIAAGVESLANETSAAPVAPIVAAQSKPQPIVPDQRQRDPYAGASLRHY